MKAAKKEFHKEKEKSRPGAAAPSAPALRPPCTQQRWRGCSNGPGTQNWKMEIIKRRDLKITIGMKKNQEHYSLNFI